MRPFCGQLNVPAIELGVPKQEQEHDYVASVHHTNLLATKVIIMNGAAAAPPAGEDAAPIAPPGKEWCDCSKCCKCVAFGPFTVEQHRTRNLPLFTGSQAAGKVIREQLRTAEKKASEAGRARKVICNCAKCVDEEGVGRIVDVRTKQKHDAAAAVGRVNNDGEMPGQPALPFEKRKFQLVPVGEHEKTFPFSDDAIRKIMDELTLIASQLAHTRLMEFLKVTSRNRPPFPSNNEEYQFVLRRWGLIKPFEIVVCAHGGCEPGEETLWRDKRDPRYIELGAICLHKMPGTSNFCGVRRDSKDTDKISYLRFEQYYESMFRDPQRYARHMHAWLHRNEWLGRLSLNHFPMTDFMHGQRMLELGSFLDPRQKRVLGELCSVCKNLIPACDVLAESGIGGTHVMVSCRYVYLVPA